MPSLKEGLFDVEMGDAETKVKVDKKGSKAKAENKPRARKEAEPKDPEPKETKMKKAKVKEGGSKAKGENPIIRYPAWWHKDGKTTTDAQRCSAEHVSIKQVDTT